MEEEMVPLVQLLQEHKVLVLLVEVVLSSFVIQFRSYYDIINWKLS